jgi:hypothetical protein
MYNFQVYSNLNDCIAVKSKEVRYSPSKYDTSLQTKIHHLEVWYSASQALYRISKNYTVLQSKLQDFKPTQTKNNWYSVNVIV